MHPGELLLLTDQPHSILVFGASENGPSAKDLTEHCCLSHVSQTTVTLGGRLSYLLAVGRAGVCVVTSILDMLSVAFPARFSFDSRDWDGVWLLLDQLLGPQASLFLAKVAQRVIGCLH